jgi:hypothetical protein
MGHYFTEASGYHDTPLRKFLHFLGIVGLMKDNQEGKAQ